MCFAVSRRPTTGRVAAWRQLSESPGLVRGYLGFERRSLPFRCSGARAGFVRRFSPPLGDKFNATVTYTHYQYVDDSRPVRYNYDELALSVSYLDEVIATVSYQPDSTLYSALALADRRSSFAYELARRWPLPPGFTLDAGVGYYDLQRLFGVHYVAGNAGLQYVYRQVTFDVTRFFADSTVSRLYDGASANGTWVLSAVYRF